MLIGNRYLSKCLTTLQLVIFVALGSSSVQAQTIASVVADVKLIHLRDEPKLVTVTATITNGPLTLNEHLSIGRYRNDGTLLERLTEMSEDGARGNSVAGAANYKGQFVINEPVPGAFIWGVALENGSLTCRSARAPLATCREPVLSSTGTPLHPPQDHVPSIVSKGPTIIIQSDITCQQSLQGIAATIESADSVKISTAFPKTDDQKFLSEVPVSIRHALAESIRAARIVTETDTSCNLRIPPFVSIGPAESSMQLTKTPEGAWTVTGW